MTLVVTVRAARWAELTAARVTAAERDRDRSSVRGAPPWYVGVPKPSSAGG
jgi:hypothetical protein